jgi:hypothetical protein
MPTAIERASRDTKMTEKLSVALERASTVGEIKDVRDKALAVQQVNAGIDPSRHRSHGVAAFLVKTPPGTRVDAAPKPRQKPGMCIGARWTNCSTSTAGVGAYVSESIVISVAAKRNGENRQLRARSRPVPSSGESSVVVPRLLRPDK